MAKSKKALVLLVFLAAVVPCASSTPHEAMESLWADLASTDGAVAYRAMGKLETAAHESISLLNDRLKPVPHVQRQKILELITGLGNEQYLFRQKAQEQLEKLQDIPEEELRKALARGPSLELQRRISQLLKKMDLLMCPERLRALRAIEVLEHIGSPQATQVLEKLARGASGAQQTREAKASLGRLAP